MKLQGAIDKSTIADGDCDILLSITDTVSTQDLVKKKYFNNTFNQLDLIDIDRMSILSTH